MNKSSLSIAAAAVAVTLVAFANIATAAQPQSCCCRTQYRVRPIVRMFERFGIGHQPKCFEPAPTVNASEPKNIEILLESEAQAAAKTDSSDATPAGPYVPAVEEEIELPLEFDENEETPTLEKVIFYDEEVDKAFTRAHTA